MDRPGVCLITPPSPFLQDERVYPFLGILNVAAVLREAGHPLQVMDLCGYQNFPDLVAYQVEQSPMDIYGITATTPQIPSAVVIARKIRELRPSAKIILGGPHVTFVTAAMKPDQKGVYRSGLPRAKRAYKDLEDNFDVLVAGDGEKAIFEAIKPGAPQLIDADDRKSSLWLSEKDLREKPFPARDLIDFDSYHFDIDGVPSTYLIAQLGCPFECGFCAGRHAHMARIFRHPGVERAVSEMVHLYKVYGKRGAMFFDDELNLDKERLMALMEGLIKAKEELGIEWSLRGYIKAELFDKDQAEAMYRAGFRILLTGFESGSPRILENIRKKATQDDNTRCVEIAKKYGLKTKALMSLGHPGESRDTIEETKRWLLDVKPHDFDATVITPYPGSPYFDNSVEGEKEVEGEMTPVFTYTAKNGDTLHQKEVIYTEEADYYKGVPGDYVSHVFTDDLSPKDLVKLRDDLEKAVRGRLHIPPNKQASAINFEHSMGQTHLPSRILRTAH